MEKKSIRQLLAQPVDPVYVEEIVKARDFIVEDMVSEGTLAHCPLEAAYFQSFMPYLTTKNETPTMMDLLALIVWDSANNISDNWPAVSRVRAEVEHEYPNISDDFAVHLQDTIIDRQKKKHFEMSLAYLERLCQPELKKITPLDQRRDEEMIELLNAFYDYRNACEMSRQQNIASDEDIKKLAIEAEECRLSSQLIRKDTYLAAICLEDDSDEDALPADTDYRMKRRRSSLASFTKEAEAWKLDDTKPGYMWGWTFNSLLKEAQALDVLSRDIVKKANEVLADKTIPLPGECELFDTWLKQERAFEAKLKSIARKSFRPSKEHLKTVVAEELAVVREYSSLTRLIAEALDLAKHIRDEHRGFGQKTL